MTDEEVHTAVEEVWALHEGESSLVAWEMFRGPEYIVVSHDGFFLTNFFSTKKNHGCPRQLWS